MKEYLINLLKKLCCNHDWEELERVDVYREFYIKGDRPIKYKFLYKCKKCGKLKVIEL